MVALVGYTNAGKSTLFNRLTRERVYAADQLFATLDTTLRRVHVPGADAVVLSDTVGFIRDLPADLVAAFHATLEELGDADLLLHVVNAAAPEPERRIEAVRKVLDQVGVGATPELLVFNQIDRLSPGVGEALAARHGGIGVSALTRQNLGELIRRAERMLPGAGARRRESAGLLAAQGGGLTA